LQTSERGRVYVAHARDQRVALKELVYATTPDAASVEAFLREGQVLSSLQHPGVPRFVAAFSDGEGASLRLYLAQELVEGASLEAAIRDRSFTVAEAKALAKEMLSILDYLHGMGIIHRDIKPANVLRRADGGIALVDFGAARGIRPDGTHRATIVGTFGYMPLEQMGGSVDNTADIYALGATLVHMLARRPPSELMTEAYELDVGKLQLEEGFTAFLRKLTARSAKDRYRSARDAARGLGTPLPMLWMERHARRFSLPTIPALAWGIAMLGVPLVLQVAGPWYARPDWVEWFMLGLLALGVPALASSLRTKSLWEALGRVGATAAGAAFLFMIGIFVQGGQLRLTDSQFFLGMVGAFVVVLLSLLFFPRPD
jgi:serine/threonine protein kinase